LRFRAQTLDLAAATNKRKKEKKEKKKDDNGTKAAYSAVTL
jgi:hypothetical protein